VTLVATNALGCTDTLRYSFIAVDDVSALVIPNVFTPNGDGFNDLFSFQETNINTIDVRIMNRWGTEVYTWSKPNSGWDGKSTDGKEIPDGVYLYIVKARGMNGKEFNYQGTVQLIRSGN
jgi:gliding motility-associated-like protein